VNRFVSRLLGLDLMGGIRRGADLRSSISSSRYAGLRVAAAVCGVPSLAALSTLKRFHPTDKIVDTECRLREEVLGSPRPVFESLDELRTVCPVSLPMGRGDGNAVVVVDNFYENPDEIRQMALDTRFIEHEPRWWVSAWESGPDPGLRGARGTRWNGDHIRHKLESILQATIRTDTWELAGDGWNGAFHVRFASPLGKFGWIHNHYGQTSLGNYETEWGWTGVLYLSRVMPSGSGTSVFIEKATGLAYSEEDVIRFRRPGQAVRAYEVEAVYNRLVLMDSRILHRAEIGFGFTPEEARLTQTFFFDVQR
jgi:hypothetical protein